MKRFAPLALAALLIASTGCHLFKRKTVAPPKQSPDISDQVEKDFEQRWLEKRTGDLVAQGSTAEAAKAQALREFREKFSYTHAAQQSN